MEKYISFACFQVVYTVPWDSLQNRCNVLHNLGRGESEVSAKLECKFFTVRLAFTCGHLKYVKCYTRSAGYTMDYPIHESLVFSWRTNNLKANVYTKTNKSGKWDTPWYTTQK